MRNNLVRPSALPPVLIPTLAVGSIVVITTATVFHVALGAAAVAWPLAALLPLVVEAHADQSFGTVETAAWRVLGAALARSAACAALLGGVAPLPAGWALAGAAVAELVALAFGVDGVDPSTTRAAHVVQVLLTLAGVLWAALALLAGL